MHKIQPSIFRHSYVHRHGIRKQVLFKSSQLCNLQRNFQVVLFLSNGLSLSTSKKAASKRVNGERQQICSGREKRKKKRKTTENRRAGWNVAARPEKNPHCFSLIVRRGTRWFSQGELTLANRKPVSRARESWPTRPCSRTLLDSRTKSGPNPTV